MPGAGGVRILAKVLTGQVRFQGDRRRWSTGHSEAAAAPVLEAMMTRRLGWSPRTLPRENDPRGYGDLGISQATLDLCRAWMDPGSPGRPHFPRRR